MFLFSAAHNSLVLQVGINPASVIAADAIAAVGHH